MSHETREAWLREAIKQMAAWFEDDGLPKIQVSVGVQAGATTLATCFYPVEDVCNIFVSPALKPEEPTRLLDILLHELVHAHGHAAGFNGHGKEFGAVARGLGLEGKMTATVASEELTERLKPIAEHLGEFPHVPMDLSLTGLGPSGKPKQTTRQRKAECPSCGYTARIAKKWMDMGMPTCPCGTDMEESE